MEKKGSAVTRRRFLQAAIAGGVAVTSVEAAPVRSAYESDRERLKRIARECGSELGAVRRAGR